MKLHIKESYEDDMLAYKQAMTDYNQAMTDYNQVKAEYDTQMQDYNKAYADWEYNTAPKVSLRIHNAIRQMIIDIVINKNNIDYRNVYFNGGRGNFTNRRTSVKYRIRIENYNQYGEDYVYTVLNELQQVLQDYLDELDAVSNVYTSTEKDNRAVTLNISYNLDVPKNAITRPTKPTKPIKPVKPVKPTAPKNAYADYEVRKKAYYDPADDIEELFYNIGGNTIPNIGQKLRQAGWITGYDIYVPTGTQFNQGPNRRVGGYVYETLQVVGGPLDGLLLPFMLDDDELCVDTFIRKYCKRI